MNVGEINTGTYGRLRDFFFVTIALMVFTVWALGALLFLHTIDEENGKAGGGANTDFLHGRRPVQRTSFWHNLGWPVVLGRRLIRKGVRKFKDTSITRR